jgi:phosphatidylethanolamine-binding protein (PEBP) family uncharacterized protein
VDDQATKIWPRLRSEREIAGQVSERSTESRLSRRVRAGCLTAAAALLAAVVAGCGHSARRSASSAQAPSSPATTATASKGAASREDAVALVAGRPIAMSAYEHWLAVEHALGAANARHRTLGFLITNVWLEDEAKARGVSVTSAQVKARLSSLDRQSFPKPGQLTAYLARAHESEADLLERVRIELLQSRIAGEVAAGHSATQRSAVLVSFQQRFQRRWKSRTTCKPAYVMEDCSEYKGPPESQPTARSAGGSTSSTPSSSSSSASTTSSSPASAGSEVQPGYEGMTVTSSAFAQAGAIPARYTCDGANVSPPLQWHNVPAKAAALVLFAIDDTTSGAASGIRWVVGDIDPATTGVAEGATPAGGIVGSDTQGHSGWGGVCPAKGQTSTIEFVLYALRKRIPLSPGFVPQVAESEYGQSHDLLGAAAVTYASYHRP